MLIYIAGLNSVKKDWIDLKLKAISHNDYEYCLLDDNIPDITGASVDDIVIIAHSMGCLTAMRLWTKFPDKIKTIQLINPTGWIFYFDFNFKIAPVTIHLGEKDEILDMPTIYNHIKVNNIKLVSYADLTHRFDENQFDIILKNIEPYLNIV